MNTERDELDAELQILIDKYSGFAVQRALEQSEWGKGELKRLLAIGRQVMEEDKQQTSAYINEVIDILTGGGKK